MEPLDFENFNPEDAMKRMFGEIIEKTCNIHGEYTGHEKSDDDCPECKKRESDKRKEIEETEAINKAMASSGLPTKYQSITFDDWIASTPEQTAARDKMYNFATGEVKRMLVIGGCGTGKTMLAAAIVREFNENYTYPIYTTVPRLIRDIRDSWGRRDDYGNKIGEQESMDKYIKAQVLIVDELGSGRCSEDDKLIFSEILCDRYSEDMPTLLISNLSSEAIKKSVLDERAADRMRENSEFVSMDWKSKRGEKGINKGEEL